MRLCDALECGLKRKQSVAIRLRIPRCERQKEFLFGHAVREGTMAQSEAGRSTAERGFSIVVLIIVTL